MPSTATITSYFTFSAPSRARATQVNNNFMNHRGHLIPINTDTATASNNTHDIGSTDHLYRNAYLGKSTLLEINSTPAAPAAGYQTTWAKTDQSIWLKDSSSNDNELTEIASLKPGMVKNLGITYSAGTLTIKGSKGTDLSASNPGFVVLQDKTNPGLLKLYRITANQNFIDAAGSSEIVGNTFGTTAAIAWANDCPFFIYAVGNDSQNAIAFMISRDPRATVSPADSAIGAPDDAVADTETSFFSFDNLDETLYDANPCLCIGAIRMVKSASDDWTVQTLTTKDGIGRFHESTKFSMPQNQNGATVGTHLIPNAGTAPDFTTETYSYWIRRDGSLYVQVYYDGDGGPDGAGAVSTNMVLPVTNRGESTMWGQGFVVNSVLGNIQVTLQPQTTYVRFIRSGGVPVTHADFGAGGREIQFSVEYKAFSD